jgi:hypothetical protein
VRHFPGVESLEAQIQYGLIAMPSSEVAEPSNAPPQRSMTMIEPMLPSSQMTKSRFDTLLMSKSGTDQLLG